MAAVPNICNTHKYLGWCVPEKNVKRECHACETVAQLYQANIPGADIIQFSINLIKEHIS